MRFLERHIEPLWVSAKRDRAAATGLAPNCGR